MEATLERGELDSQHRGCFCVAQPLEIAQDQHLAIRRRETLQGSTDLNLLVQPKPVARARYSPPRCDTQFLQRRRVSCCNGLRSSRCTIGLPSSNGEQPGSSAAAALERRRLSPGRQKGLLQDVFGIFGAGREGAAEPENRRLMAIRESQKGLPISCRALMQQCFV